MRITNVGCGNASSYINFNSAFLLEEGSRRMLVDCGYYTPLALHHLGIPIDLIDDIYISHSHGDHCGGLENIAFQRYDWVGRPERFDDPKRTKKYAPRLICNEELMKDLWNYTLRGGLESFEGLDATLETCFEPIPIKRNESFIWEGWKFSLVQQIHIITNTTFKWTFGLFIEKEGHQTIYITTDAQYVQPEQILTFFRKADIIFADCECIGVDTSNFNMLFKSGVHANYAQFAGWEKVNAYRMPEDIKKKLWLTHYQDFVTLCKDHFGNPCDWDERAEKDGFAGFVKVGQVFEF